jgi:hypothetical protein
VRYCSLICKNSAVSYHGLECGFSNCFPDFLVAQGLDPGWTMHHLLALRLFAHQPLEYYLAEEAELLRSDLKAGTKEGGVVLEPGHIHSLAKLVSHRERMDPASLLPLLLSTVFLIKQLQVS